MISIFILGLLIYSIFVAIRLGMHQRLPLAWGRISLEKIPDRAAKMYGERTIFTSDTPVAWEVPGLRLRYPSRVAWSAARIKSTAGYVAEMLRERMDVRPGDRVAILKENHLDFHILMTSIVRAGAIACPMNPQFPADKVLPYLVNIGAHVLISDTPTMLRILLDGGSINAETVVIAEKRETSPRTAQLEMLLESKHPDTHLLWLEDELTTISDENAAVAKSADDPLYLVHSSGTTGFPKAVILKNGAQSHAVRGWLCYVHLSRTRDKGLLAVPNNHQAVILSFNSLLLLGLPVHWTKAYNREDFDPEAIIGQLSRGGYTGFFGFPVTYTQMKEVALSNFNLSRMRFWATTADASHEAIVRMFVVVGGAFKSVGLPVTGSVFLDAQGSSEVGTPSVIRYISPFTRKFDRRIGRPGSTPFGPRMRVMTTDGRKVRRGEPGRFEVKGKTIFGGYWNNHALTYAVFRDGWFFTGDVVRRDGDGHFVQLDREVDVLHTANGAVYSLPIEEVVHKHPAVFDVCVYGARQKDGTQLPVAAVALRNGVEIAAECLRRDLNAHLQPRDQLWRVDVLRWTDFPIGITGKTLKRVFRERTETSEIVEQNRPLSFAVAE